jgi:hypothetical protein
LKSIGFDWDGVRGGKVDNKRWMGMFETLVAYNEQHQNTMVPQQYEEDPKLGIWVFTQRNNYKKDVLLPKRLVLLESIGFDWDGVRGGKVDNKRWMGMFGKLVAYNEQHQNTMVPQQYEEDPKLGWGVTTQRRNYKKDVLLPNRIAILKSIGFT